MSTPSAQPTPVEQLQQRISTLEKEVSKPILLKFIEVTTEEKVALAVGSGKVEGMVANIAANAVKAEFNFFDPIKLFGLQDFYDEALMNRFRSEERKKELQDQKPENLLKEIRESQRLLTKVKNEVDGLPDFPEMRKDIDKKADLSSVNRRFDKLHGSSNPRDDIPKVRGKAGPVPSLRQLQQQELQLRKTIAHFVRVVKGAVPEAAALSDEMAEIERQLKK